jgi:hypothetical protein
MTMNFTNDKTLGEIERLVIKERYRSVFRILKMMMKILVLDRIKKLIPKGGKPKFYSPRMVMHPETVDDNMHCTITTIKT